MAIMRVELGTGRSNRELPVDADAFLITLFDKSEDLLGQTLLSGNATMKALTSQSRELNFNHVEPTGRLGRVNKLKALRESKGLAGWQMGIERSGIVGIE